MQIITTPSPINNYDNVYYPGLDLYTGVDERMVDHISGPLSPQPNDIVISFFGHKITKNELDTKIALHAKSLKKYGLQPGDKITMVMPNTPETIYYLYACNAIGLTPYLVDPRYTFTGIKTCIENSDSKLLISDLETYHKKIATHVNELPLDNIVVVSALNTLCEAPNKNMEQLAKTELYPIKVFWERLKNGFPNSSKMLDHNDFLKLAQYFEGDYNVAYDPERIAMIVNTSGTSKDGIIKGAMHYDRSFNIYASNQIDKITDELYPGYSYFGYIPFFTMYGSIMMHTALTRGIIFDCIPKLDKKSLKHMCDDSNIVVSVPPVIEALSSYAEKRGGNHTIKTAVIGGENVSPATLELIEGRLTEGGLFEVIYGYGLTEVFPVFTTSKDPRSHVPGSVGVPYPGVTAVIVNPDTLEIVKDGEEGEILVNTPNMMKGYLGHPEINDEVFVEINGMRFFRTGDKGYKNPDGIYFITGRYKRFMKRFVEGHQVSPIRIENSVSSHEAVKKCCAVGIKRSPDDKEARVCPTAFIVLENRKELEKSGELESIIFDINKHALENSGAGEREGALAYVIVDEIPQTNMGKDDFTMLEKNTFSQLIASGAQIFSVPSSADESAVREYFKGLDVNIIKSRGLSRVRKPKNKR